MYRHEYRVIISLAFDRWSALPASQRALGVMNRWRYIICYMRCTISQCRKNRRGHILYCIVYILYTEISIHWPFFLLLLFSPDPPHWYVQWLCQMTSLIPSKPPDWCLSKEKKKAILSDHMLLCNTRHLLYEIKKNLPGRPYRFVRRVRRRWNLRRWNNSTSCSGTATGTRRCRPWPRDPPSSCDPGRVGTIWPGQATAQGFACTAAGLPPCRAEDSATPRSPGRRDSCQGEKNRK